MGKFIITRTAAGDSFCLQSDRGHTLAVSRRYATLDACKKGIASLIVNAPVMPVRDATAGERGPNPKFEIVSGERGFLFLVKSPNGKTVITSQSYATKKACLRAIAMLRRGVLEYEILFHTREGYTPLTMKVPNGAVGRPAAPKASKAPTPPPITAQPLPQEDEVWIEDAEVDFDATPIPEAVVATQAPEVSPEPAPQTPRLIRLQPTDRAVQPSNRGAARQPQAKKSASAVSRGILGRLFKGK